MPEKTDTEWRDLSAEEARDLVGKRVRIIWMGGPGVGLPREDDLGFCVKNCCEEVHVRCVLRDGHFCYQERRTPKSEDPEV